MLKCLMIEIISVLALKDLLVLYSEYTPEGLQISLSPDLEMLQLADPEDIDSLDSSYRSVLDLTNSITYSVHIQHFAYEKNVLHINPLKQYEALGPNSINLYISEPEEKEALDSLLKHLEIESHILVYCIDAYMDFQLFIMSSEYLFPISCASSVDQISFILNHSLKNRPENTIVLAVDSDSASKILQAASIVSIDNGYIWILLPEANYLKSHTNSTLEQNGPILMYHPLVSMSDKLQAVLEASKDCNFSYSLFRNCMNERLNIQEKYLEPRYEVYNIQNFTYVSLGYIDDSVIQMNTTGIVWPGGEKRETARREIRISRDSGLYSSSGTFLDFLVPAYQGSELAISYINNITEVLPYYFLSANEFNFGGLEFDHALATNELADKDLNNILIAPAMSDVTLGVYNELWTQASELPIVGYSNTVTDLSDMDQFLWYTRVCMSDNYQAFLLPLVCQYFQWTKVGVLYLNNSFSRTLNEEFERQADLSGIEILNRGGNLLPGDSATWSTADLDPILLALGHSEARIIIVFCYTMDIRPILLRMHDLGFHGPEYEYIAVGWLVDELLNGNENLANQAIIRDALRGSIMLFPPSFTGEFGDFVYELFNSTFGNEPVGYSGFAFDAVLASAHALEYVLSSGKDINDKSILMKALREVNFVGATGTVSVMKNSNDRYPMDHIIANTQEHNGEWEIKEIGLFSPTRHNLFTFYEPVVWTDSSYNVPSDSPPTYKCSYKDNKDEESSVSRALIYLVAGVLAVGSLIAGKINWIVFKGIEEKEAEEKKSLSFSDLLAISLIVVDFVQWIAIIPSTLIIASMFQIAGSWLNIHLEEFYEGEGIFFWIIYRVSLAVASVSLMIKLISLKYQTALVKISLSISTHLLYMSVLGSLTKIYICFRGGSSARETVLEYDCKTYCYEGMHLYYVIFGSLILALYMTWAPYQTFKSIYDTDSNIFVKPVFVLGRTLLQSCVVYLRMILFDQEKIAFCLIFILLMIVFSFFTYKTRAFNLDLLTLCSVLSSCMVIWLLFIALIESFLTDSVKVLWYLLLSGWLFIILCGIAVKIVYKMSWPYESNEKQRNELFKFAFSSPRREVPDFLKKQMPQIITLRDRFTEFSVPPTSPSTNQSKITPQSIFEVNKSY